MEQFQDFPTTLLGAQAMETYERQIVSQDHTKTALPAITPSQPGMGFLMML